MKSGASSASAEAVSTSTFSLAWASASTTSERVSGEMLVGGSCLHAEDRFRAEMPATAKIHIEIVFRLSISQGV